MRRRKGKAPPEADVCSCPSDTPSCKCPVSRTVSGTRLLDETVTSEMAILMGKKKLRDYDTANGELSKTYRPARPEKWLSLHQRTPGVAFMEQRKMLKSYSMAKTPYVYYPTMLMPPGLLNYPKSQFQVEEEMETEEDKILKKVNLTEKDRVATECMQKRRLEMEREREVLEAERERMCIFCRRLPRCVLVQPCMHMATCQKCSDHLLYNTSSCGGSRLCPVCLEPALGRVLVLKQV